MQNDNLLIEKIKTLKSIKPDTNWAILNKNRIMSKRMVIEKKESFSVKEFIIGIKFLMSHKYAFSSLIALLVVVGVCGLSQKSGPGDTLYSLKKALEQTQTVLLSQAEKSKYNLEQANNRLADLQKIAQGNQTKKLGAAINEYKASVSEVAKNLTSESDQGKIKEIAQGVKLLAEKEKEIKSLGVEIDSNADMDLALVEKIMEEVNKLKLSDLSENQREVLNQVEEACKNRDFADALDKISSIGNDKENSNTENKTEEAKPAENTDGNNAQ
jgi:hypothetical protein